MPRRKAPLGDFCPEVFGEAQEAKRVGYGGAVEAETAGKLILGQGGAFHETAIRLRLVYGVEVLALEVLNEGDFELLFVAESTRKHRNA